MENEYFAQFYSNAKDFLSHRIQEHELIPAFKNDVDSLVRYWKYGDLSKDELTKLESKYKNNIDRFKNVVRLKSGVKGHVKHLKTKIYLTTNHLHILVVI